MFNPLNDYETERVSDRTERRVSCNRCMGQITHKAPISAVCFACWAGHPRITRPVTHPEQHPHYAATLKRLRDRAEWLAKFRKPMELV